ncbi:MAG TPA: hypothetical protein VMA83_11485 [Solirubrobacteraceae bacterium]|nr:hypothetical protein [Solirubrobacteraceae bacterium]
MSILPKLERDLVDAAHRRLVGADGVAVGAAKTAGARVTTRRLRLPLIAAACVLAMASITLAAVGVLRTGRPVRPEEVLNPRVGEGIPVRGASRLLPLRVADPEGGLPWGMRIVHTTRGEICVQIGRVQNGQLGELGIDGAFHDDGRFHPIPVVALPRDAFRGRIFPVSPGCQLEGTALTAEEKGRDRSADWPTTYRGWPKRDLRNIYFGLLGPEAVSVAYHTDASGRSQQVVPGLGAYLIVKAATRVPPSGGYEASPGTPGELAPELPMTSITYRLDGKLCERVPSVAPWETAYHVGDPCPSIPRAPRPAPTRDLRKPLSVHLHIRHDEVTGATLNFIAPYAVTSARSAYTWGIRTPPACEPHNLINGKHVATGGGGGTGETLGRDVNKGARITWRIGQPFALTCAGHRTATIEVFYDTGGSLPPIALRVQGGARGTVLVGRATIKPPPGIRP